MQSAKQDHYVRVGDVRTRYRAAGERGTPLVLIHGLGASLESWQYNLAALGKHHRVFAPDVVWFGKTDKPAREVTMEYFAEFIRGFMDAVNVRRAVLVGNSLGGMIATKTALQYPTRVAGLVLVNSAGFGRELGWWLRLRTLLNLSLRVRPSKSLIRLGLSQLFYNPNVVGDDLIAAFLEMANQTGSAAASQRVLRSGVNLFGLRDDLVRDIRDAAHTLRAPTLIVWGKQDRLIPVAHADVARRRIPHARVHIFEECGHVPMIERAAEFNQLVTDFVREEVTRPRTTFAQDWFRAPGLTRALNQVKAFFTSPR